MILGISEPILIVGIIMGALVATSVNQMRPKRNIPLAEIYLKKGGAIVWFIDANDRWWPYALKKTRNGYFAVYNDNIKGVFHINPKKRFYMAGSNTPCYAINTKDMNNFNPIDIGKVNEFLDKNGIFKLRRKDMKHLEKLRILRQRLGKKEASAELDSIVSKEAPEIDNAIDSAMNEAQAHVDTFNKDKNSNLVLDDDTAAKYLIDYMLKHDFVDDKEAETLLFKLENGMLDLGSLKQEFKDIAKVSISETIDVDINRIVDDFGSQNPLELTGVMDDGRTNIKELKKMTPVPVKQFIPGGVILAVGLVIIIGFVVIAQNPDIFDGLMGGGFKLPGLSILKHFNPF